MVGALVGHELTATVDVFNNTTYAVKLQAIGGWKCDGLVIFYIVRIVFNSVV